MQVQQLIVYPLKSTRGITVENARVDGMGLQHDRRLGLFDARGVVITARDFPAMLDIQCVPEQDGFVIKAPGQPELQIRPGEWQKGLAKLDVWENEAYATSADDKINRWFADYLGAPCRLMVMDERGRRDLPPQVGGQSGDQLSFADECPILLAGQASIDDLNARLDDPVPISRFRPNVVIKGTDAFIEDSWKRISIGAVEFEVTQQCKRCVLTTIDEDTKQKHPRQEPLRTLTGYRRHPRGGGAFGVHLVRRSEGTIKLGNSIKVLE